MLLKTDLQLSHWQTWLTYRQENEVKVIESGQQSSGKAQPKSPGEFELRLYGILSIYTIDLPLRYC